MCGIAGYRIKYRVDEQVLLRMLGAMYNRGPDSVGYFHSGDYHAGMRRLSINDLKTGDQPLFNADRSVALLYNGEIYNYPELRRELEDDGYKFSTHSDGEVICHLHQKYGENLFEKLDGMFAAALWIEKEKKLILVRDIPGEKPLYYAKLSETSLVFASEIKSIIHFPKIDLSLDYQAIWDFPTFLWIPEPDTIYQHVKALPPGHILISDHSGMCIKKYKNRFGKRYLDFTDNEMIAETREVVESSIRSRLLSDVPVGCFLSGGLDSSLVTTIASKYMKKLTTFTIGFENRHDPYHGMADESSYAEAYAKKLGTIHHTIRVKAEDFLAHLDDFCLYADQPFSVSSGLGILMIAKAARNAGIKVLLSGDGADECFGGYSWYKYVGGNTDQMAEKHGCGNDVSFQNFGLPLSARLRILKDYSPQKRAWAWHYYASESEKVKLYSTDLSSKVKSSLRIFYDYNATRRWVPEDFIKQDRLCYLPNEMLRKVDRMTMAHSVEGRTPFTAPSVLALSEHLKYSQMVRDDKLKWILRKAFEDLIPEDIINREKHGFNVPIDYWLKNDWHFLMENAFSKNSAIYQHGLLSENSGFIADNMLNDDNRLNGHTLFSFIMLNLWFANHGKN